MFSWHGYADGEYGILSSWDWSYALSNDNFVLPIHDCGCSCLCCTMYPCQEPLLEWNLKASYRLLWRTVNVISFCTNILISCLVSFTWCTNLFCQKKILIWVGFLCHRNCAKLLVDCHMAAAAESKLRVIYCKFSNPNRGSVALFTPAKCFQATWSWRNDQNLILYSIHIIVLNWISESSDLVDIFEYI